MRDPRKPVIPLSVEEDESHALLLRNGEIRSAHNITLHSDDVGRIQAGYVCVRCYETQERPFPKECWVCKFPMAERQMEFFGRAFLGDKHIGPTLSMEDELELLKETEELMLREELGFKPSNHILVPRGFS